MSLTNSKLKSLVQRLNAFGLKEGSTVYFYRWSPKFNYRWERMKFSFHHSVYGNYPNLYKEHKSGSKETLSLMQNSGQFKFKNKIFKF